MVSYCGTMGASRAQRDAAGAAATASTSPIARAVLMAFLLSATFPGYRLPATGYYFRGFSVIVSFPLSEIASTQGVYIASAAEGRTRNVPGCSQTRR